MLFPRICFSCFGLVPEPAVSRLLSQPGAGRLPFSAAQTNPIYILKHSEGNFNIFYGCPAPSAAYSLDSKTPAAILTASAAFSTIVPSLPYILLHRLSTSIKAMAAIKKMIMISTYPPKFFIKKHLPFLLVCSGRCVLCSCCHYEIMRLENPVSEIQLCLFQIPKHVISVIKTALGPYSQIK